MSDANGTMKRLEAQAKVQEAIVKNRNVYLSRVGTSIAVQLDTLLDSQHDRLSVVIGLAAAMAVRGNAKWEEIERVLKHSFEFHQKALAPPAPAPDEEATPIP